MTKAQFYKEVFKEYPLLFSKRGFEKNRVKCIIPIDRKKLAYIADVNGVKLNIDL